MNTDFVEQALAVADIAHRGQTDKLGKPYIDHPIAVAELLDKNDYYGRAVAYLHDVFEDTDMTPAILYWLGMPVSVVEAVEAITHSPYEANEVYWLRVRLNPIALRVKDADIRHNMSKKRLELVPEPDKSRLIKKYTRAREFLGLPQLEVEID